MSTSAFDPVRYKETTREQWQAAARAWNDWGLFLREWLGPATACSTWPPAPATRRSR